VPSNRTEPGGRLGAAALARIALALLALATVGALLIAERLKQKPSLVIASAIWHPSQGSFDPRTSTATFSFDTHYRDDLSVSIVGAGGAVVVLARNYPVAPYRRTEIFRWNGRTATGKLAPAGAYVVQVHFDRLDRTTQVPQISFQLKYASG
jgi:hypothetical protein